MFHVDVHYHSHRGHRDRNEDRAVVLAAGRVFAVSDGMGGVHGGETASRVAVETVQAQVQAGALQALSGRVDVLEGLRQIVREANRRILAAARNDPHPNGMGTTLTLACLHQEDLVFAHVGDTRLYLWRSGTCEQLTEDHTQTQEFVRRGWVSPAEAAHSPYRHVLIKYLGTPHQVEPQTGSRRVQAGDRILMCSDGLYGELELDHLSALLGADRPARELAENMVLTVSASGRPGLDNITALVVRLDSV